MILKKRTKKTKKKHHLCPVTTVNLGMIDPLMFLCDQGSRWSRFVFPNFNIVVYTQYIQRTVEEIFLGKNSHRRERKPCLLPRHCDVWYGVKTIALVQRPQRQRGKRRRYKMVTYDARTWKSRTGDRGNGWKKSASSSKRRSIPAYLGNCSMTIMLKCVISSAMYMYKPAYHPELMLMLSCSHGWGVMNEGPNTSGLMNVPMNNSMQSIQDVFSI